MSEIRRARGIFQKEPDGPYYIRFTDAKGKQRKQRVGPYSLAVKILDKRKADATEGRVLGPLRRRAVSFSEIAEDCLARSDKRKRSQRVDHSRMNKLREWFDTMPADSLTAKEIERRFQGESWSPATWNRYKALLSLTYRLAIRNDKAKQNPARLVEHKKESDGRTSFLTVEQEKRLRPVIAEKFPERLPEFELALHTGMRHSEQYGAKWKDVDFANRIITVIVYKNKDGAPRTTYVRLNDQAISALLELHKRTAETGLVCGGVAGATDWFEDCLKAAGIADFSWHCLRHTFASRLSMTGADPRAVAELLRDKTLHMAMRYSHLAPDFTQEAVERMGSQFTISPPLAPEPSARKARVN